ncbi:MAG: trigger factor [Oscillospiraceae bacterium]
MNLVSNKVLENKKVELEIQVTAEDFKVAVDNAFKKNSKKMTLPGFRKGKAPRTMVEKMYGVEIFYEDAINECFPKAYSQAIDQLNIDPVERAEIEIVGEVAAEGFTFKATVAVKPEVVLGKYKGITAEKQDAEVEDTEVDAEINKIADRNARMIDVEGRPAQNGDTTVIDFEGFADGVAFEGGKGENYPLNLGAGQFIPGFEEQIVGHSIDEEFDVNVTFPEEYQADELKGKPAVFKVKIHEIKNKELPEIDDEFAKDVSEFDTIAEFKADMKAKMSERKTAAVEEQFETALLNAVVADMQVELPQAMIDSRVEDLLRDFEYRLSSQGLDLKTYLQYTGSDIEMMKKTFAVQAEQQVKTRLALEAIGKAENIEVSAEEIENEYNKLATRFNVKIEEAKKAIGEESIKQDIICNKAIDIVKQNGEETAEKKTEKKTTAKRTCKKKVDEAVAETEE